MARSQSAISKDNQIALIGKDAVNAIYNEKQRAYRAKIKAAKILKVKAAKLESKAPDISKTQVVAPTKDRYITIVSNLYRLKYGEPWDHETIDFLLDNVNLMELILNKYTNANSIKNQINAVIQILGKFDSYADIIAIYKKELNKYFILANDRYIDNIVVDGETIKPWNNIKNLYMEAKGVDKIYLSLISLMPVRRLKDYALLVVSNDKLATNEDYNYIILDGDKVPIEIVYNNYKTKGVYGIQRFELNWELSDIIKAYVKDFNMFDYVFGNKSDPSLYFSNILKRACGTSLTINSLRKSYVSWFLANKPNATEKRRVANAMSHSLNMQRNYERTDI